MKVDIRNSPDGKVIVTQEDIWFTYCGRRYCVQAGFESDGASVPRLLWRLLSPCIDPQTLVPSIIHDYIYRYAIGMRCDADIWYVNALEGNGYPTWKCLLTYVGLSLFGWFYWRRNG